MKAWNEHSQDEQNEIWANLKHIYNKHGNPDWLNAPKVTM